MVGAPKLPVSYTHLDVYKRQAHFPARWECISYKIQLAVSYTHLDVYKRQYYILAFKINKTTHVKQKNCRH